MITGIRGFPRTAGLFAAALLTVLAACSRNRTGEATDPNAPAILVFTNESLAQADVFAIPSGSIARRLGTVMAGRTETLEVPPDIANRGTVRIVARLLASNSTPSSGPITLSPGEKLQVRLPLDQKTLVVLPAS
jgi:hypothetical protein